MEVSKIRPPDLVVLGSGRTVGAHGPAAVAQRFLQTPKEMR